MTFTWTNLGLQLESFVRCPWSGQTLVFRFLNRNLRSTHNKHDITAVTSSKFHSRFSNDPLSHKKRKPVKTNCICLFFHLHHSHNILLLSRHKSHNDRSGGGSLFTIHGFSHDQVPKHLISQYRYLVSGTMPEIWALTTNNPNFFASQA